MPRYFLHAILIAGLAFECASRAAPAPPARIERGSLIYDGIPEASADTGVGPDAYANGRDAQPLGWSPDGHLLIATRFAEVDQLHEVDRPIGSRYQLTFEHEPVSVAAYSPEPGRKAYWFLENTAAGGFAQLFYQRAHEPAKPVTDGKSSTVAALWSSSGRQIAFSTTARGFAMDIDIVDPAAGSLPRVAVTGDAAAWIPLDWSPDDRKLLVLRCESQDDCNLYVVDLESGQRREIDAGAGKASIRGGKFSRDGQAVYLVSDRDSEFAVLRYVNLFSNDRTVLSSAIKGDIEELALSRDGRYLAFVSNESGIGKLNLMDLRAHQDLTPPKMPSAGLVRGLYFDADAKRLTFGFQSALQPSDAYVLDLADNRIEPWTRSELGPLEGTALIAPRLTQFPTFDKTDGHTRLIPLYDYQPTRPGPHPVLIWLGATDGEFRPGYQPLLEYVARELGFAVVAPNLRGSSGYGKAYRAASKGTQRDDAIKDLGSLIVWLSTQSNFDAKHVAVAGEGYGGYLALTALVNYGDRLMGGIEVGGPPDLLAFLANAPPYRLGALRADFGDERDPDMRAYLRRISPLSSLDRITRPLLVVQGKKDPDVPSSDADQLVNRLRSRGNAVWYLGSSDEGSHFARQASREAYFRITAQFLRSLH